jgi:hypothetical protein
MSQPKEIARKALIRFFIRMREQLTQAAGEWIRLRIIIGQLA